MAGVLEVGVIVDRDNVVKRVRDECLGKLKVCKEQLLDVDRERGERDCDTRGDQIVEEKRHAQLVKTNIEALNNLDRWLAALRKPEEAYANGSILWLETSNQKQEVWLVCATGEQAAAPIDHSAIAKQLGVDQFMIISPKCPLFSRSIADKVIRAGTEIVIGVTGNPDSNWEVLEVL